MVTGRLLPLDLTQLPTMLFGGQSLRIEEYTDGDAYVIRVEVPGLDPDKDIRLSVFGDRLQIRVERTDERLDKAHSEFHYGVSTRTLQLPLDAQTDGITAGYATGILEIRVPLTGRAEPGREIPITVPGKAAPKKQ
ncbi:Hsp20/alpha crystallin family protein [Dactylosporangium sp. AC04546]|uniref:Hsp20/alpha crystallin family protein n=1 Tax=Dactylosporangium sp. AC04546 TaxID=2862460 RepID=UPI001EE11B94|nr:Hsp20/alpha crystallin family protein [Dactylosporangium sp. AC04546]WVK78512.1 Hsp20/alpha crystallin family protein [Dactylosporangium sp. AC04546]